MPDELAALLKVSPYTLRNWRCAAKDPRFLYVGRSGRNRRAAIADWLAEQ